MSVKRTGFSPRERRWGRWLLVILGLAAVLLGGFYLGKNFTAESSPQVIGHRSRRSATQLLSDSLSSFDVDNGFERRQPETKTVMVHTSDFPFRLRGCSNSLSHWLLAQRNYADMVDTLRDINDRLDRKENKNQIWTVLREYDKRLKSEVQMQFPIVEDCQLGSSGTVPKIIVF